MSQTQDKEGMREGGEVSVWISRLSWFALPALIRTFLKHGRFNLQFTSVTGGGIVVARLLEMTRILASPARQIRYTGHGQRVDDPDSRTFQIHAKTNEFTAHFFARHGELIKALGYPDARVKPDRVLINLRKVAAQDTCELLAFVEFARYRNQAEGVAPRDLVILSSAAVLANHILPGWAGDDVEFDCPWDRRHSLFLRLGRSLLQVVHQAIRRQHQSPAARASVGIAAVWGLDRFMRLNDLFWWWGSGIPAERLVLFFDQADWPAAHEVVDYANRLGIKCVVLDPSAVGDSPHLLWRTSPGLKLSIHRLWRTLKVFGWGLSHGEIGGWVACRVLDTLYWSAKLEDFFVYFNVRAAFHYQDSNLDHVSMACEAVGAVRIGHHWSNHHFPVAYHARLHQVYFAWGSHDANILEEVGSCVDHLLLSGSIVRGAHPEGDGDRTVKQYRASVTAHGATRVLALFDTSLPCEHFYEYFLRRVIQDPRWGLLIKPKSVVDLPWVRQRLLELQALYEQALATGRVRMLDWRLSPAEVAAAADFAVGVDINSATVVAWLAGRRAIHLDYVRLQGSALSDWAHFHKAGPDRLVFDNPDKLWERLNRYFDKPGCDPDLGVVDDVLLHEIDPFRDGRAGQRIGEYLRWYLEGLDSGLERDRALERADHLYAENWGADKVVRGLPSGELATMGAGSERSIVACEGKRSPSAVAS